MASNTNEGEGCLGLVSGSVNTHSTVNDQHNNSRYHALCLSSHVTTSPLGWEFAGPTTYVNAFDDKNVENDSGGSPKWDSAAAVQNVVQAANHTWFIGSVNGGIW